MPTVVRGGFEATSFLFPSMQASNCSSSSSLPLIQPCLLVGILVGPPPRKPAKQTQITFMGSPGQVRTLKRQRSRFFGSQGCMVETQTTVEDRIPLSDNFHVEDR